MNKLFLCLSLLVTLTACVKPSVSCFTFSPSMIQTGDTITFDASCSQNAYEFTWNFGDGLPDTATTGGSSTISYIYNIPGQYIVTLKTERKDGTPLKKGKPVQRRIVDVQ